MHILSFNEKNKKIAKEKMKTIDTKIIINSNLIFFDLGKNKFYIYKNKYGVCDKVVTLQDMYLYLNKAIIDYV